MRRVDEDLEKVDRAYGSSYPNLIPGDIRRLQHSPNPVDDERKYEYTFDWKYLTSPVINRSSSSGGSDAPYYFVGTVRNT